MAENLVKYFTMGEICSLPAKMKCGTRSIFREGAGHGPKCAWLAVLKIIGSVGIPLLGHFRHRSKNLVLLKEAGEDASLKPRVTILGFVQD